MERLKMTSRVVAASEQVSSELDGEAVILDLASGVYYGLDGVGAHVWRTIQTPKRIEEIREEILERFQVEPERCTRDLFAFLRELERKKLVRITDESME